jgi:hypothetical protein
VTPGYFPATKIPILEGRDLQERKPSGVRLARLALGGDPSRVSLTVALTSLKAVIAGAIGGILASAAAALVVAGSAATLIAARMG